VSGPRHHERCNSWRLRSARPRGHHAESRQVAGRRRLPHRVDITHVRSALVRRLAPVSIARRAVLKLSNAAPVERCCGLIISEILGYRDFTRSPQALTCRPLRDRVHRCLRRQPVLAVRGALSCKGERRPDSCVNGPWIIHCSPARR
jgi:hypothetical protein